MYEIDYAYKYYSIGDLKLQIRKVDENNDWQFGKGLSDYARDELAIDLNIKTRLQSWVNDCFFDLGAGVDWANRLDVGQVDSLRDEIKDVILKSFGVLTINRVEVDFNPNTRMFSAIYNVDTIYSNNVERTFELIESVP